MSWDRAAFFEFNAGVERARAAYDVEPNACAGWCVRCVYPAGSNNRCIRCRETVRGRVWRAQRRKA